MFDLTTDLEFYNDLLDELKLFTRCYDGAPVSVGVDVDLTEGFVCRVDIGNNEYKYSCCAPSAATKKTFKRFVKLALYRALSAHYGVELPWGSLTGVRPTKLAYEHVHATGGYDGIAAFLHDEFCVSKRKARTIEDILRVQRGTVADLQDKVNLYVHVPFCDGRCSYCSFPAADMNKQGALLDDYVDALIREIAAVKEVIAAQNKTVLSVYVGGGTPSVLLPKQLERLLAAIDINGVEFTFEAGRPDSITPAKLALLKSGGVTRVCINPQSLNDKTLLAIGRRHSAADFFEAYEQTAAAGFSVNTDIIAGLQGESFEDFKVTLDGVAALRPDNITVHTLSRKRGSKLADATLKCNEIEKMMDHAYETLSGYEPYYLYRQKYMVGNLENVGFCLPGKVCVNNVTVMEELVSVYACGAGSISKKIGKVAIDRHASPKDVKLFLDQFDVRLKTKLEFFKK